ncbi:hypothetical protein [Cohnella abietis]|uniref:Uncharacterized protein n=1 Tax=Cohnella abietis TaxID=2507935 RepID=A0A3T1DEB0_9BACL|nr:hypothetical protein [Cohnella abietis]BBI36491.1 hypothetical protein KCTCHS21_58900 [Cohnella abietis]
MQLLEAFKLNEEGYALIQKFISRRVELDIEDERQELEALTTKQLEISQKSGFFNSINKLHKDHATSKADERIRHKVAWKDNWDAHHISSLNSELRSYSIHDLIHKHIGTVIGRVQLYLILQEVVHTPIYYAQDSSKAVGDERNFEKTINSFSQLCGLNNIGFKIFEDTKAFFKEIKRELSHLPEEAVALNVAKVTNFINHLKSNDNPDRSSTGHSLAEAQTLFLEFKRTAEHEIVFNNASKNKKEDLSLLDILNDGLKRII